MMPAAVEWRTGCHVGGISPLAQKKRVPIAIEQSALGHASIYINGGQRGLQIELAPADARVALGTIVAALVA